jgi:two-component system response regulator YesN
VVNRLFENTISVKEFREKASFFGMHVAGDAFWVAVFLPRPARPAGDMTADHMALFHTTAGLCARAMGAELCAAGVTDAHGRLACLLRGTAGHPETVDTVREAVARAARALETALSAPVTAGIGGPAPTLETVWQSHDQALRCLDYGVLVGDKPIVTPRDFDCGEALPDRRPFTPDLPLITDCLAHKKKTELAAYIHTAFGRLSESAAVTLEVARAVSMQIVISVMTFLRTMQGDIVYLKHILNFNYGDLLGLTRLSDFEAWLSAFCAAAIDFISTTVESGRPALIRDTLAYIEKNYATGLSLKLIAYLYRVNASYLGQVFKRETGQSFVHYVNAFRIKKARELLADTRFKIHEVARRVGFSDPHYFLKIFKQYTGFRPSDLKHP